MILKLNPLGGASGDMLLAALIELGADLLLINEQLNSLIPNLKIIFNPITRDHITGVEIKIPHTETHFHRYFSDVQQLIEKSTLSKQVKQTALLFFRKLAESEAKVHGTTVEKVAFHEVGALDSIGDMVGIAIALEQLHIQAIHFPALPCGYGTIECAHGLIPNPAPATASLLENVPQIQINEPFELVTPTAAAILTSLPFNHLKTPYLVQKTARAFGSRTLQTRPNLLVAQLVELEPQCSQTNACVILQCDIDDCSPEILGYVQNMALECGALDVTQQAVYMKKNRLGTQMNILCRPDEVNEFSELLFKQTTTLGIRVIHVERLTLNRTITTRETLCGTCRVKQGFLSGELLTEKMEFEDLKQMSEKTNIPIKNIF